MMTVDIKLLLQGIHFFLILILAGCAAPELLFEQEAKRLNFHRTIVPGTTFKHVVYINEIQDDSDDLHVYLDGDGSPWINNRWISEDPTPRKLLVFRLMAQDTLPAVYLGRPCYHRLSETPPCEPSLWTNNRYSMAVVTTMAAAIGQVTKLLHKKRVVLIGYSGGGTLAMLLAGQLKDVLGIVTIAGNLDIEAWTQLHGYSPLSGSINPAQQPPLNQKLFQLHYAGEKDENIPVRISRATVRNQHSAHLTLMPKFDHYCCWEKAWPLILKDIQLHSINATP